jgi:hypothetical protein
MIFKESIVSILSVGSQEWKPFVVDEIRRRLDGSFLGKQKSPQARGEINAMILSTIKDMERAGRIYKPLTEQDVAGITEIMLLEWNIANYTDHLQTRLLNGFIDGEVESRTAEPDVRLICGAMSEQAIVALTASYGVLADCNNVAKFFFLEKMRRDELIKDWRFIWTNYGCRSGDLIIEPSSSIQHIDVNIDLADPT